jgi:hypothetical protein
MFPKCAIAIQSPGEPHETEVAPPNVDSLGIGRLAIVQFDPVSVAAIGRDAKSPGSNSPTATQLLIAVQLTLSSEASGRVLTIASYDQTPPDNVSTTGSDDDVPTATHQFDPRQEMEVRDTLSGVVSTGRGVAVQ